MFSGFFFLLCCACKLARVYPFMLLAGSSTLVTTNRRSSEDNGSSILAHVYVHFVILEFPTGVNNYAVTSLTGVLQYKKWKTVADHLYICYSAEVILIPSVFLSTMNAYQVIQEAQLSQKKSDFMMWSITLKSLKVLNCFLLGAWLSHCCSPRHFFGIT